MGITAFVLENYENMKYKEMAEICGVTYHSINTVVKRLLQEGKLERKNRKWTYEEDKYLLDNYKRLDKSVLARKMGMTKKQMMDRHFKLVNEITGRNQLKTKTMLMKEKKEEEKINKMYEEIINRKEPKQGLDLNDLKFNEGQIYKIKIIDRNKIKIFEGRLIQDTINHITIQNKIGIRESFLKKDLLIKEEYEVVS